MYAVVKDGVFESEVVGNIHWSPDHYQSAESLSPEERQRFNLYWIVDAQGPLSPTQKWGDPIYTIDGDKVIRTWVAVEKTADEIAADLSASKAAMALAIDDAVIALYQRPTTLSEEYKMREAAAVAYKAAGYYGSVPQTLKGFSDHSGMTPTDATKLILAQATQFRAALATLADLRMSKYAVMRAQTEADAKAVYDLTMAAIVQIAATLS